MMRSMMLAMKQAAADDVGDHSLAGALDNDDDDSHSAMMTVVIHMILHPSMMGWCSRALMAMV